MSLLGPVFAFDLKRQTRRRLTLLLRNVYLAGLFLVLLIAHAQTPGQRVARMTEAVFTTFLVVQFLLVVGLTPALTAGAIAEEKEGQTLPFLLCSGLRDYEIVLGKLASRLVGVVLVLLGGLPVFALLQLLGGVDPAWLLAGFAVSGVTLLSLAAVGIAWSVLLPRSRDAVLFAYLSPALYLLVALGSRALLRVKGLAEFPSTEDWESPVILEDVILAFNAGDPFRAFNRGLATLRGAESASLSLIVLGYLAFHGICTSLSLALAVYRFRRLALKEAGQQKDDGFRPDLPPITGNPILWRELHTGRFRMSLAARVVVGLLVVLSFAPACHILFSYPPGAWGDRYGGLQLWSGIVGSLVASLLLLVVGVRAAASFPLERQNGTLDLLLLTTLEPREILVGKWGGVLASIRLGWVWLAAILVPGFCCAGLSPLALPVMGLCWFIYANAGISIGLWISLRSRSTLRATATTAGVTLALWVLPSVALLLCCTNPAGEAGAFVALGLSPPATFASLSLFPPDAELTPIYGYILVGVFAWILAGVIVWGAMRDQFDWHSGPLGGSSRTPHADRMT